MTTQLQRVCSSSHSGHKADLVLLHGWGDDNGIWQPLLPQLERYFNLHCVDLPDSAAQQEHEFPAGLEALLPKLLPRLPARAAYLGRSLGGTVATALATRYPERVSALVTVATNPRFVSRTCRPAAMPTAALDRQIPYLAILGTEDKTVPIALAQPRPQSFNTVEVWQATGCDHTPQRSRPTAVAARVIDFLLPQPAQARAKMAVAQSFGRAHRYDEAAGLQRETGDELLKLAPASQQHRVVDLGCGSGYFTPRLASRFSAGHTIAVDIATGMLQRARETGIEADWLAGDAEQLPLADASVDLLYSNLAVQWCENLQALSQEIARVLRPGGQALLSTLGPSTLWELRAAWRMLDQATHVNSFARPELLRQQLSAAGLCIEVYRVENWTRRVDTVQQLARELRDIGAHNLNSGRRLGLTGRRRWRDLGEAYGLLHDAEAGLPVTWQLCFLKVQKIAVA